MRWARPTGGVIRVEQQLAVAAGILAHGGMHGQGMNPNLVLFIALAVLVGGLAVIVRAGSEDAGEPAEEDEPEMAGEEAEAVRGKG